MNLRSGRGAVLDELAAVICEIQLTHPVRVAINGVDGAGKTRFADELFAPCLKSGREIIRASIDGFHNPRSIRYARGKLSPEGYFRDSFDNDALINSLPGRTKTLLFGMQPESTGRCNHRQQRFIKPSPDLEPTGSYGDRPLNPLIQNGEFVICHFWESRPLFNEMTID